MKNDEMIYRAKDLAAMTINKELIKKSKESDVVLGSRNDDPHDIQLVSASDMYVVWFAKTLQNWKALVSTSKIKTGDPVGDYVEVTHNGDKNETYCDLYKKQRNVCYPD